jgi:hypothetical protein
MAFLHHDLLWGGKDMGVLCDGVYREEAEEKEELVSHGRTVSAKIMKKPECSASGLDL